ncbi:MAG: HD domain-containing protein [Acidaminococcaceae bacterium]|nr:HD domain-containing protein [Acidaminococcaceae bacterium]
MISIPKSLDFLIEDNTREVCDFYMKLLKVKNKHIYTHSCQVANYAASIAAKLGLDTKEIGCIKMSALLHDIGTLAVPNNILNKYPYLSVRESAAYRRHAAAGAAMLENLPEFSNIVHIIHNHHETWDGKGYPNHIKGNNIPIGARIVAVADYYDANINPATQNYRKPPEKALKELKDKMGTLFDPDVVKAFMAVLPKPKEKKE